MDIALKSLRAEIKAVANEGSPNGEFEAILSTEAVDREGESVSAKAFDPLPAGIPIYHAHDWMAAALPIGRAEPYYEGDTLKAKGYFASTTKAQEVRTLVNEGIVTSMSVGYLTGSKKTLKDGTKVVTKGDLIEASFTAIPVNTTAAVLASKSVAEAIDKGTMTPKDVREWLKSPEVKAGARNNATDASRLQTIHDLSVENGASCSGTTASKSLTAMRTKQAVAGSYEDRQEDIREALAEANDAAIAAAYPDSQPGDRIDLITLIATFDNRVVYRIGYRWDDDYDDALQVGYMWDGEEVTLTGDPTPVQVDLAISPANADEAAEAAANKSLDNAPDGTSAPAAKAVGAVEKSGAEDEGAVPGADDVAAEVAVRLLAIEAAVLAATAA